MRIDLVDMTEGDALDLIQAFDQPIDLLVTDPPYAFGGAGEVYFEFWIQGRTVSARAHADTYLGALTELRRDPVADNLFARPERAALAYEQDAE